MKNLFIINTPYHLVLATGIVNQYKEDSDLIIYNDFNLENIKFNCISSIFNNIHIYDANKNDVNHKSKIANIKLKIKNIKKLINNKKYDQIFVFNEGFIETQYLINNNLYNENSKVIYIEDGSNVYMDLDFINRENSIKRVVKSIICGFKYEDLQYVSGMHSKIYKKMVMWPNILRQAVIEDNKPIEEIKKETLEAGLNLCYNNPIDESVINKSAVLILIEHLEFFEIHKDSDLELYRNAIKLIICRLKSDNIQIYLKYHPRDESNYLEDIFNEFNENINIIENSIPAEVYFLNIDTLVISVFSTTLLTAAKMVSPKNVISLADIMLMSENNLRDSFLKIGIQVPKNIEELQRLL